MGDSVAAAATLHRAAILQFDRGRLDLAQGKLRTALSTLDADPDRTEARQAIRGRVLISLFNVECELSGHPYPVDLLEEADSIATAIGADDLTFAISNARGLRAMRDGEGDAALQHFSRAADHLSVAPTEDACVLMLNRGTLRLEHLSLDQAREDFTGCITLAESSASVGPDPSTGSGREDDRRSLLNLAFMAGHNLGYVEFLAGNLPAALQRMDHADAMPVDGSRAIAYLDKARVLIAAGLVDSADRTLLAAEQEFRRGRLHQELAETLVARAECALLARDWAAARRLARAARTRFRRRGNHRWRRIADLTLLQADLADHEGRAPARLVAPATRLEQEFVTHGLVQQGRIAGLIACAALIADDRVEEAQERFARIKPAATTDPITLRLHHRAVAAELSLRSGQRDAARHEIRRGLRELTGHQAQFGSIDLQTSSAIHGRRLVELDLQSALSSHRPDSLFNAVERSRAVSRRLTSVTPPTDESRELLAELRHLTEIIRELSNDPDATGSVQGMRTRTRAIYAELGSISWRVLGAGRSGSPAPLSSVRTEIERRDTALVSFCAIRDTWAAVVVGDGAPRLVELPDAGQTPELVRRAQADLNVLAFRSLPAELRTTVSTSLRRTMERLDATLIAPLRLDDRPVVLVPTGVLATFSWGSLPSLSGRPVTVSPTATGWLDQVTLQQPRPDPLAVQVLAGPGLETASGEAAAVARAWRDRQATTSERTGPAATRESLAAALATASVVHVAAHGTHQRQNPLFSSLHLADGPLFAYEIEADPIAEHIVLSACELGQNTLRPGDETLGLTSVLLQLGARCVVAGVAQVADEVAATVMADYHHRLADGADAATSLAASIQAADEPYIPFVCFGSSWQSP